MTADRAPEDWSAAFRAERGEWEIACARLTQLLYALLAERVDVAQVEARLKSIDSFVGKLRRKAGAYPNPLTDMPDILGLRVITYYEEDIDDVGEILKSEFDVIDTESSAKIDLLDPDRFGYLSVHYVVRFGENRRDLPEWRSFANRKAEIQVRTVLQHAWAAIDHKLQYKRESEIPKALRRGLFRLSALLEVGDKEFSRLRNQALEIRADYEQSIRAGSLQLELVADSLQTYLSEGDRATKWLDRAFSAGFQPDDGDSEQNERVMRFVLRLAEALGLDSLADLDGRLQAAVDRGVIEEIARDDTAENAVMPETSIYDLLAYLLLYGARANERLLATLDNSPWVEEADAWFKDRFEDEASSSGD